MDNSPIGSVAIIGGGTAGWSAAACLVRFLSKRNVSITLIESSTIGTVGVGEASIPNIRNFNDYIGLDELDFIESTGGTFKLGIRFDDWRAKGRSFFHPFGDYGVPFQDLDFHQCLFEAQNKGFQGELSEFSLPIALSNTSRFSQPSNNPDAPLSQYAYAYHFDATRYAKRLKKFSVARGVMHLDALVTDVELNTESGFIDAVRLENGTRVEADLFVDCSGFRALLIEEALETGYESWQQWLPCDRAVAMPCTSSGPELAPHTVATARDAGWTWEIPLQHRTGNGYVYSSAHLSADDAVGELTRAMPGSPLAEPNHQRFTAGMRRRFWTKNCVSLGLSSGFIEPLESTSINLVHRALSILMDFFPGTACDQRLSDSANVIFTGEQERIRDFIILHYKLSSRTDTPFWNDVRAAPIPDSLAAKIDAYRANGSIMQGQYESFRAESWLTMYNGFGVKPETLDTRLADIDFGDVQRALTTMKTNIANGISNAMPHSEFVQRFCPSPDLGEQ